MKRFGWPQFFILVALTPLIVGAVFGTILIIVTKDLKILFFLVILILTIIGVIVELIDSMKKKGKSQ